MMYRGAHVERRLDATYTHMHREDMANDPMRNGYRTRTLIHHTPKHTNKAPTNEPAHIATQVFKYIYVCAYPQPFRLRVRVSA